MNDSVYDFVQIFTDALTGPDGLGLYTLFVSAVSIICGFFLCTFFTLFDGLCQFVLPFFRRKLKVFKAKHHSEE